MNSIFHWLEKILDLLLNNLMPLSLEQLVNDYDKTESLRAIAALQLLPENHGKNLRFELLLKKIVAEGQSSKKRISRNKLQQFFKANFRSYYMEDPVSAFFTENIIFFGGDFTVFPGINSHGTVLVSAYLEAIFTFDNDIPTNFKDIIYDGVQCMLSLSNEVATKASLKRYIFQRPTKNAIKVPDRKLYDRLRESVFIDQKTIEVLSERHRFNVNALEYFTVDPTKDDLSDDDPDNNPVAVKPLVKHENGVILINPGASLNAITEFILAQSRQLNYFSQLLNVLYQRQWHRVKHLLHDIHWHETNITLPVANNLLAEEAVYRFDNNKLAYVCFVKPSSVPLSSSLQSVNDREQQVIKYLKELNGEIKYRYLTLFILGEYGGTTFFAFNKPSEDNATVTFSFTDFKTLVDSGDLDALTIWKFAKIYKITSEKTDISSFGGMLDSYLHSDHARPDFLQFPIGNSDDFRREVYRKRDEHSVLKFSTQGTLHAPVKRLRKYGPVYIELQPIDGHSILLESFVPPVWVINRQVSSEEMKEAANPFLEAVAFWLFRMANELSPFMNQFGMLPVQIQINLHESYFQMGAVSKEVKNEADILIETLINGRTAIVSLPEDLMPLLMLPSNNGEKLIMRFVLSALRQLQEAHDHPLKFSEDAIVAWIENFMQPSNAKMILFFDTSENLRLDNRWLLPYRPIQESEVSLILDNIVAMLNYGQPIPEKIESDKDKIKLCNDIVFRLVNQIIEKLKLFNSEELIRWLIKYHERTVHKREFREIHIPAKIACFSSFTEEVEKLHAEEPELVATSLSLRCLIEFVVAGPSEGSLWPNVDDIDELIALMDQVIQWAVLSDTINFKFDDPEMGLLPSGRIGTNKKFATEKLAPFYRLKVEAIVNEYLENFDVAPQTHQPLIKPDDADAVEKAIKAEWQINLTKLLWLHGELVRIAIEGNDSMGKAYYDDLLKLLKERLPELNDAELLAGINLLTLTQRPSILKAPTGYDKTDIYPWIYSRALSYLRKPLLLFQRKDGQKIFYWGFRHMLSAAENLKYLLYTGRLTAKSSALDDLLSEINRRKGKIFRNKVAKWLCENTELNVVEYEVDIDLKGHLVADKNYGDIDILAIDESRKKILSIECKDTVSARIIHEMKTELDKYLGRPGSTGKIQKHIDRDTWLKVYVDQLSKYVANPRTYEIQSVVISSEELPLSYISKSSIPIPIISFSRVKSYGPYAYEI
jgi:hypothetical protein